MDNFSVALSGLDELGAKVLPGIAQMTHDARCEVRNASSWISRAFGTHDDFTVGAATPTMRPPSMRQLFHQPGSEIYLAVDYLTRALDDNRENVELAAQAIIEIGRRYRQADGRPDESSPATGVIDHAPVSRGPSGIDYEADGQWKRAMGEHADVLTRLMREHDDDGIGAAAQLDIRLRRIFDEFASGEDAATQVMIHHLAAAQHRLIQDPNELFGAADGCVQEWHGTAADQFKSYLRQLRDGVSGVLVLDLAGLDTVLRAHQALISAMRRDVLDLVERTLRGIEAAETDSWKVGASIVGALAAIAAGVAAAGPVGPPLLMSLAATLMGAGTSVAIEAKGADSELGVIVQCVDAGEAMIHLIDGERAKIEHALRIVTSSFTGDNLPQIRPDRPLIVTSPDFRPETFGLTDETQGRHRKPTDTRDLVPEPTRDANGSFDDRTVGDRVEDRYPEQGPAA